MINEWKMDKITSIDWMFKIPMKQFLFIVLTLCFFYSISQKIVDGATLLNRGLDFRQGGLVPEERLRSPLFDFTIGIN